MWIRSQDRKQILRVNGLGITKVFGGKKKGVIIAYTNSPSLLDASNSVVAQYDTEDEAMMELNRFEEHLVEAPNSIFNLR